MSHSETARQWVHVGSGLFGLLLRALTQFIFCSSQIAQPVLPFRFQSPSNKTIFRLACFVTALRAVGFVASAFDLQLPQPERSIAIRLELFPRQVTTLLLPLE